MKSQLRLCLAFVALFTVATESGPAFAQLVCPPPEAGLVAWYRGEGNADDFAQGNDGTLQGGADFASGHVGQAFRLDGTDGAVSAPSTSANDPTIHGSLAAWINLDELPSAAGHVMQIIGKGSGNDDFDLQVNTDNKLHFLVGAGFTAHSTTVVSTGDWIHVVGTWDQDTGVNIYVNGIFEGEVDDNVTRGMSGESLVIGDQPASGPRFLDGRIDEVMVFNRELTAIEVADIACIPQLCGDASNDREIKTSDALLILRSAVGQSVKCPPNRCDTDDSGSIAASDALRALKLAVGQEIELECPPPELPG